MSPAHSCLLLKVLSYACPIELGMIAGFALFGLLFYLFVWSECGSATCPKQRRTQFIFWGFGRMVVPVVLFLNVSARQTEWVYRKGISLSDFADMPKPLLSTHTNLSPRFLIKVAVDNLLTTHLCMITGPYLCLHLLTFCLPFHSTPLPNILMWGDGRTGYGYQMTLQGLIRDQGLGPEWQPDGEGCRS